MKMNVNGRHNVTDAHHARSRVNRNGESGATPRTREEECRRHDSFERSEAGFRAVYGRVVEILEKIGQEVLGLLGEVQSTSRQFSPAK
jgi:hypothetical protein